MTDRVCICVRNKDGKLLAPRDPKCPVHASSNRVPTRERLAEIAACVISGELDWGVPSMEDTDPWEIADLILKEFGRAIPNSAAYDNTPDYSAATDHGKDEGEWAVPPDATPNSVRCPCSAPFCVLINAIKDYTGWADTRAIDAAYRIKDAV